ncbi:TPA: hypothetical protein ACYLN4_007573 [Burkholderia lata]
MGIETYRVRSSRLARYLASKHGLQLSTSDALRAIAAEEGIPRDNWNELAARAKNEPVENKSELVAGTPGSGKSLYAQRCAINALAAERPVLIISARGEHHFVKALGGSVHRINPDGTLSIEKGANPTIKLAMLEFDTLGCHLNDFHYQNLPSLKDLGFSKPDLREITVIADEFHHYGKSAWFIEMLRTIAEYECAEVKLVGQLLAEFSVEVIVAGRIMKARLFRLSEFEALRAFGDELGEKIATLRQGESIEIRFPFSFPRTDLSRLAANAELAEAVMQNTWSKIFFKMPSSDNFLDFLGADVRLRNIRAWKPAGEGIQLDYSHVGSVSVIVGESASDEILANSLGPQHSGMIARVVGLNGYDVQARGAWSDIKALWLKHGIEVVMGAAKPPQVIVHVQQTEPAKQIEITREGNVLTAKVGDGVSDTEFEKWCAYALRTAPETIRFFVDEGSDVTTRICWEDMKQSMLNRGFEVIVSRPSGKQSRSATGQQSE